MKSRNPNITKVSKATQWKPGESGNLKGRPEGISRSTIARKVLQMQCELPDQAFEQIKKIYPDIEKKLSAEEMATIVQITNAILKGDTNAYKAVMDSAYVNPQQDTLVQLINYDVTLKL